MTERRVPSSSLPPIPDKRYFTIGEVSDLCGVKAHVLRYWESEFEQLKPMKRGGNRRYYQRHEVLLIRQIRELLYEQKFTIIGAKKRLAGLAVDELEMVETPVQQPSMTPPASSTPVVDVTALRRELSLLVRLLEP